MIVDMIDLEIFGGTAQNDRIDRKAHNRNLRTLDKQDGNACEFLHEGFRDHLEHNEDENNLHVIQCFGRYWCMYSLPKGWQHIYEAEQEYHGHIAAVGNTNILYCDVTF